MGKVTFDQTGYVGSSMSKRAADAYASGEMPKSKWTKKAMLSAISEWCDENGRTLTSDLSKLKKDDLFERFFAWTSWHHTGSFASETDFYGINENELRKVSRELTAEESESIERATRERISAERKHAEEQAEHERLAEEDASKELASLGALADVIRARNAAFTKDSALLKTVAADEAMHPEDYSIRVSSKGNVILTNIRTYCETPLSDAYRRRIQL
jgi:hypothetical protein